MRRARAATAACALLAVLAASLVTPAGAAEEVITEDPVSVAVFLVLDTEIDNKTQALLMRGMEGALKQNERLDVKDKDLLLAAFGGEIPEDKVEEARVLFQAGADLLEAGDAPAAVEKLEAAEVAFEKVLAFVKKNELADCQFVLGAAYAAAGDKKKARAALLRLQVWRSGYAWEIERYAELVPLWESAKQEIEKGARGSLEIMSEPEGAMAFVDGRYVGVTPTSADALPVGDHYVTLKLEGYQRKVIKAKVDARYQELVTEALPPSEKYLLVEQSVERAAPALGDEAADVAMLDLRNFLFIDMAVFLRVEKKGAKLALTAYLYDLRSKRRLSMVSGAVIDPKKPGEVDEKLDEIGRALFTNIRYDGKGPKPKPGKKRRVGPEPPKPFYKTWWFWTGVAVGTAAVIAPIVFYDDIVGPTPPSCAPGTICTGLEISF